MSAGSPSDIGYAQSGEISIAYQTIGDGPIDVVMAPGFPSHLELQNRAVDAGDHCTYSTCST